MWGEVEAPRRCDATSSGWTRPRRCEYRQTTVQEPWGATGARPVDMMDTSLRAVPTSPQAAEHRHGNQGPRNQAA